MITVIFLTLISWTHPGSPMDSLRMETINGKQYIIHRIDEKETLYSISKRYGVPISAILEVNPASDGGLATGQLLKIPYTGKGNRVPSQAPSQTGADRIHKVAPGETLYAISRLYDVKVEDIKTWNNLKDNTLSTGQELIIKKKSAITTTGNTLPEKSKSTMHTVAAGETMYAIARQYGITVQQLKDWNGLQGNELKVGQTVMITQPMYDTKTLPKQEETKLAVTEVKEPVETKQSEIRPPQKSEETTITISEKVIGSDEVKESGLAELIEGSEGNRKYLALHRTAKEGTILKVRNELNNREVFVRVAGSLPNTGNNTNVVIKISKSAYDRLGAIDQRFRVEVTYYK